MSSSRTRLLERDHVAVVQEDVGLVEVVDVGLDVGLGARLVGGVAAELEIELRIDRHARRLEAARAGHHEHAAQSPAAEDLLVVARQLDGDLELRRLGVAVRARERIGDERLREVHPPGKRCAGSWDLLDFDAQIHESTPERRGTIVEAAPTSRRTAVGAAT